MELRHLRYFVAVAQRGHFGRAAQDLRLASSSLSQQIRALERDLATELFDRTPSGASLTPAGRVLLEHARSVLARADRARDAVHTRAGGRIDLRLAPGLATALAPGLRAAGPGIEGTISHEADAVAAVAQERADAALVWAGAATGDLCRRTVAVVPVLVALPAAHPLAADRAVAAARLAATVLLAPAHLAGALRRCGATLDICAVADAAGDPDREVRRRVAAGGFGLVCDSGPEIRDRLTVRAVHPALVLTVEMVWRDPGPDGLSRVIETLGRAMVR